MSLPFDNDIKNRTSEITSVQTKKDSSSCTNCLVCLGGLTVVSLVLGLIAAIVCYYYFGIKYLVEYEDENGECNSHVWDYVLTSLICSFVLGSSQTNSNKSEKSSIGQKTCANVFIGMIWIGIGIWGFIETENENCTTIRDTPLWTFGHTISIIQLVIGCLSFVISCVVICFN